MKCGGKRDSDFYRMRCVLACVGKDRMRPELLRVLVEKAKGGVTVVGCDGTRLRRDFFTMRAEPGLYEVRTNTSKTIYLEPSTVLVRYPDYRKVVPKCDGRDVYAISGKGSRFVMWVGAALGCYVDPKLMALGDDEMVDVVIQKADARTSPVLIQNDKSLLIVMPMKLDGGVGEQLDRYQLDRLGRQRKMIVVKPKSRPKAKTEPWWSILARHKAA